ncbi:hypothetical protein CYY_007886 [Polysphondylium violaceum]|uniref:Uncharacterized protein n=1 Tax=Polysphondylium violaceum TaxID=133409 RepID=A0A8J4PMS6_9MYCE|nr:hypothetical protein CYY_007886 [Polysphondylium violaceum]
MDSSINQINTAEGGVTNSQCSNVAVERKNVFYYTFIENEDLIDTICGQVESTPIEVEKRCTSNHCAQEKLLAVQMISSPIFTTKCVYEN